MKTTREVSERIANEVSAAMVASAQRIACKTILAAGLPMPTYSVVLYVIRRAPALDHLF